MQELATLLKNIEQSIKENKFAEAQEKIPQAALLLLDQIENKILVGSEIGQASDRFSNLFKIQLEKKIFPPEIEELLQRCFSLHGILPYDSKEFQTELKSIKKLVKNLQPKIE